MTKQDPSKLCKACKAFDQMMNDQGEGDIRLSLDVYVQCEHEEEMTESKCPVCSQWISDPFTDKIRCPECGQTGEQLKKEMERKSALEELTTQAQEMGLYENNGPTGDPDFPFGPIPHWIKCSDRLPEDNEYVLAFGENEIAVMQFRKTSDGRHKKVMGYFQNIERGEIIEATHWMPLPETPSPDA